MQVKVDLAFSLVWSRGIISVHVAEVNEHSVTEQKPASVSFKFTLC